MQEFSVQELIIKYKIDRYFEDITPFMTCMKLLTFPKNTYLYSHEEHKKYVYFLIEGKLQVYATMEDGRQMLVRKCEEFIFLGDMELLGYREDSNMIETVTECTFLTIDISVCREQLMQDRKFLRFLCDCLAEKISYFARIQFRNRTNTPREKVAIYVLQEADKNNCFRTNLRGASEFLAVSYRHLHRILGEFVDNGILERAEPGYIIRKRRELEAIASGENADKI